MPAAANSIRISHRLTPRTNYEGRRTPQKLAPPALPSSRRCVSARSAGPARLRHALSSPSRPVSLPFRRPLLICHVSFVLSPSLLSVIPSPGSAHASPLPRCRPFSGLSVSLLVLVLSVACTSQQGLPAPCPLCQLCQLFSTICPVPLILSDLGTGFLGIRGRGCYFFAGSERSGPAQRQPAAFSAGNVGSHDAKNGKREFLL